MADKKTIKNIARYFSSSLFSSLLGIVNAFIKPRLLSPELYGLWNLLNIIPLYASYSHLGTRTVMRYLLPLNLGQNQHREAAELKGNVILGSLAICSLIALLLILAALLGDFSLPVKSGLLTMAVVIWLEWYFANYAAILKGYQEFKLLTRAFYLKSGLTFVLGITLMFFFSIYGLYVSLIVSFVLVNIYLYRSFPLGPRSGFTLKRFGQYVRSGFPMLIFSLGALIIGTTDRIIIASLLGNEQLGYYGIAIMILGFFLTIPDATREVMEPQLMSGLSSRSEQQTTQQFFFKPLINLAFLLPMVMGPVLFIIPVLIPLLLPDYSAGIVPTQIIIAGGYFLALSHSARGVIIANNLQLKAIVIMSLAIVVNIMLNVLFIHYGLGITGVAIGSSLSYLLLFVTLVLFIHKHCVYSRQDWQESIKAIIFLVPVLGILIVLLLYICQHWFTNEYIAAFAGLGVYWIVAYGLIITATKKCTLLSTLNWRSLF